MKTRAFYTTAALALLICGSHTSVAQQLPVSAPIITQLAELDRYGVTFIACSTATNTAWVGLPYENLTRSKVEAMVRDGVRLHRSIRIMVGQRVVAECRLVGVFSRPVGQECRLAAQICGPVRVFSQPPEAAKEYGLLLGFDSREEAKRIASLLRLEPSVDDLIRSRKKELDDQRFWLL
jgi:hypothetical protein